MNNHSNIAYYKSNNPHQVQQRAVNFLAQSWTQFNRSQPTPTTNPLAFHSSNSHCTSSINSMCLFYLLNRLMTIYANDNNNGVKGNWMEREVQRSVYERGGQWGRRMTKGSNRDNNDRRYSSCRQRGDDCNNHHRLLSARKDGNNNNNNNNNSNNNNKTVNKYNKYQPTSMKRLLAPSSSVHKLQVPQPNSLTDQFLQRVLGSQQGLIGEYDRCVNPQKYEYERKQQMMERVKNQWRNGGSNNINQSNNNNNNININNNSSIWMMSTVTSEGSTKHYDYNNNNPSLKRNIINQELTRKGGAFYDEQHYNYLKTNMKYLTDMGQLRRGNNNNNNSNSNNNMKKVMQEFKKSVGNSLYNSTVIDHNCSTSNQPADTNDTENINNTSNYNHNFNHNYNNQTLSSPYSNPTKIVTKIQQTGGIQNTIKKMENSLKKNQLKHLKTNQYLTHSINTTQSSSMQYSTPLTAGKFYNSPQTNKIINTKLQQPKYSHNYNQPPTTIKKQKMRRTHYQISQDNNTQVPLSCISSPTSRPSWRDRSKSMRNKIQQNIDNNK